MFIMTTMLLTSSMEYISKRGGKGGKYNYRVGPTNMNVGLLKLSLKSKMLHRLSVEALHVRL